MSDDNLHYAQMTLTMISTVCLVYLALNSFPLFIAMATFQTALVGAVIWKGVRREVQNGNK